MRSRPDFVSTTPTLCRHLPAVECRIPSAGLLYYPAIYMGAFATALEALASAGCSYAMAELCIAAARDAAELCVSLPFDGGLWLVHPSDGRWHLYAGMVRLAMSPGDCLGSLQAHRRASALDQAQDALGELQASVDLEVVEFVCDRVAMQ